MEHILKATCETVHLGGFSDRLPPALEVVSGDTVEVETFTGFGVCDRAPAAFVPPELQAIVQNLSPERKVGAGPHLLTGPIFVRDAKPGDVLEVRLDAIWPRLPVGFNIIRPGWGALPERFSREALRFIELDLERAIAEFPPGSGVQIPLQPFFGILGVATAQRDRSSVPPGPYGGNIDNRHLRPGSRLWLPVFVPGALFSLGDGHAAQGDGEVDVTAIETAMNGRVTLVLRDDLDVTMPIAETPTHWILFGFAESLDRALQEALEAAIAFLVRHLGTDAEAAYVLCSLAVDFHVTQVVNAPQKGIHALVPKSILPGAISL